MKQAITKKIFKKEDIAIANKYYEDLLCGIFEEYVKEIGVVIGLNAIYIVWR